MNRTRVLHRVGDSRHVGTCRTLLLPVMMVSDASVRRYYYIFDSRDRRPLVVDRRTGEEVAWATAPRVQLVEHVTEREGPSCYRRFARWCALQTDARAARSETPTGRLWAAIKDRREGPVDVPTDLVRAIVEATTLGLSRRRTEAARLLTVHACTHSSARQAAIQAAHMSERWAEFAADGAPERAARALRQRQVDWLLDELGPPQ